MKKRILAIILTFAMVLTLVPVFAVTSSADGETYTLTFNSANFGTPNSQTSVVEEGGYIVLPTPSATRYANSSQSQYTGWKCSVDNNIYYSGQIYYPTANATFTAQYIGSAWSGNGNCWINIAVANWANFSGGDKPTAYQNNGLTTIIGGTSLMSPSASTNAQNFTRINNTTAFTAYDYGTVARPGDGTNGVGVAGVNFAYYVFNPTGYTSYSPTTNSTTVYENYAGEGCVKIYPGDTVKMVATSSPAFSPLVTHIADGSQETVTITSYSNYNGCFYIYPIFEAAEVSVNYYPNDGVNTEPTAVADIVVPECAFVRDGYNFLYWNTEADGTGTIYLPGETTAAADVALYAIWSDTADTAVIYYLNGGVGENFETLVTGTNLTAASDENISRRGCTFVSWNTAENGSGTTYAVGDEITSTMRLYAQWRYIVYTLTFDANGGIPSNPVKNYTLYFCAGGRCTQSGGSVGTTGWTQFSWFSSQFTRPGYTYTGLNSAADGTGEVSVTAAGDYAEPTTWPLENIVLYAQWTENEYTTNYDANGGTGTQEAVVGGLAIANPFTAPANQRFVCWNTAADGTGTAYAAGQGLAADGLTLYAIWEDIIYTVTYNANGGEGEMANTVSASAGAAAVVAANAFTAPEGYQFAGWNTAADGTGTAYAVGAEISEDVTLYAIWAEIPVAPATIVLANGSALVLDGETHFVTNITVGMTVAEFLAEFEGEYVVYTVNNEVAASSATVGTGMVIALVVNEEIVDSYTVVVYGDLDGDGNINVNDIVALRSHIGADTLAGKPAFIEAANADRAGGINVNDIVAIRGDINGSAINQGAVEAE